MASEGEHKANNSRQVVCRQIEAVRRPKGSMNRNRTIAQQVGQPERRITRFLSSSRFGRRRVTLDVGRSTANRNEPQVLRALDTLSPSDAVSRARLRMTVDEALGAEHNSL